MFTSGLDRKKQIKKLKIKIRMNSDKLRMALGGSSACRAPGWRYTPFSVYLKNK